jgi:hypothetical protein
MNWEAIGEISDTAGVIVVVASVWYLAAQVRKQTDEARMTATRELARDFSEVTGDISRDPELTSLYRRAIGDIDSLEDDDRLRIGMLFTRVFRCYEQHYLHVFGNTVESLYIESINTRMREMLTFPGVQRWWALNNAAFEVNFRSYVDALLIEAKTIGYQSSFRKDAETEA